MNYLVYIEWSEMPIKTDKTVNFCDSKEKEK